MAASSNCFNLLELSAAGLRKALGKKMSISQLYHILHLPSNAITALHSNKRLVILSTLQTPDFPELHGNFGLASSRAGRLAGNWRGAVDGKIILTFYRLFGYYSSRFI